MLLECSANFAGASSEMEQMAVKEMFSTSLEHNLRYKWLVADGDSKYYLDIWNIHGACKPCNKYQHLITKRDSPEFAAWTKTKEFKEWQDAHKGHSTCKAVIEIDYIQHIGKCFRNKLDDLAKKGCKASDGLSIYTGANRLGPGTGKQLQRYFNNAVRKNICPGVLDPQQMDEAIKKMHTAILASLATVL